MKNIILTLLILSSTCLAVGHEREINYFCGPVHATDHVPAFGASTYSMTCTLGSGENTPKSCEIYSIAKVGIVGGTKIHVATLDVNHFFSQSPYSLAFAFPSNKATLFIGSLLSQCSAKDSRQSTSF